VTEASQVEQGKIGVVTVTYNSEPVLQEFFDSLAGQTYRSFVLYVVDNASKDNTMEMARQRTDLPIVIIANAENLGVAEGNNQGIRAALADNCDAVLLLNNDTVFPAEMFTQLREGLARYGCTMTTPKIYYHNEPNKIWTAGGYFQPWLGYRTQHYGEGQQDKGQFDIVRTVTYAPTCCVLIHKDVFRHIGLMDPLYFVYVDDVDFMYRAYKAGFVMKYLPQCKLWHKVNSLTGGLSSFTIHYCTRNHIYFLRKHLHFGLARIWTAAYLVYFFSRRLISKDSKPVWLAKWGAVKEGTLMHLGSRSQLPPMHT